MLTLSEILSEADKLSLSSITETQSNLCLTPLQFKSAIKQRIHQFHTDYQLTSGHSVLILNNNTIDFFISFFALLCMEVTVVPFDKNGHVKEIKNVIDSLKPSLIIREELWETGKGEIAEDLRGMALVLFTSGTTSTPKGVLITKRALLKKIDILAHFIPTNEIENSLCFLPTFFGHGLICNSLFPLLQGKNFYISPKLNFALAADLAALIHRYQISFFSTVPSHWELISNFDSPKSRYLKRVHCASAPLRTQKISPIREWIKEASLYDVYGATEMLGWFAARKVEDNFKEGNFTKFWDADTRLSKNQELEVKSSYMFSGYWDGTTISTEEYFNTGDYFINNKIMGRSKNVVIKNGVNIYTDELDAELMGSNLLIAAATFPVADDFCGERIAAFVILKKGVSLESLKIFCKSNISLDRIPSDFKIVDAIPVNVRGKSSFVELQKAYLES